MLQLISHIVRTSSRRDRTEINAALIDAMADLFNPVSVTIYRCYPSSRGTMLFACAGIASGSVTSTTPIFPIAAIAAPSTRNRSSPAAAGNVPWRWSPCPEEQIAWLFPSSS